MNKLNLYQSHLANTQSVVALMLTIFLYFSSSYHPSALKCTRLCLRSMPVAQNQKPLPLNLVRNSVHDFMFLKQFLRLWIINTSCIVRYSPASGRAGKMTCVWCLCLHPKQTHTHVFSSGPVYGVLGQNTVWCRLYGQFELFSAPALFLSAIFMLTLSRIASASGAIA